MNVRPLNVIKFIKNLTPKFETFWLKSIILLQSLSMKCTEKPALREIISASPAVEK